MEAATVGDELHSTAGTGWLLAAGIRAVTLTSLRATVLRGIDHIDRTLLRALAARIPTERLEYNTPDRHCDTVCHVLP